MIVRAPAGRDRPTSPAAGPAARPIASVVDCHSIWTAMATFCRRTGHALESSPPPYGFVTGKLSVNYLKPGRQLPRAATGFGMRERRSHYGSRQGPGVSMRAVLCHVRADHIV